MATCLADLARSLTGPFAFCGIGVARRGAATFHTSAARGIVADDTSMFRVASVSKVITGMLMETGLADADISVALRYVGGEQTMRLRHPDWPDVPITRAMLASHTAGLHDDAGYAVSAGQTLTGWLQDKRRAVWSDHRPGTHFAYSNLGYVILGTALERQGRFDRLALALLERLGVRGGFNWSGVCAADRAHALATYRRDGEILVPQIDAQIAPEGVTDPDGNARDLRGYKPGQNAGLFAPQGGLRTNLHGMLRIAETLRDRVPTILWSPDMGTMDSENGLFDQYGPGVQILRKPPFYPRALIGHFGNAYGFTGGVWYDAETETAFAYALNGRAMGDESDALSAEEQRIFAAIAALEE